MDEPIAGEPEVVAEAGSSQPDLAAAAAGTTAPVTETPHTWIALPVGRAETGPTIAQLVAAVRAAGGMVGGQALFDPRYEPEMRRFLIAGSGDGGDSSPEGR